MPIELRNVPSVEALFDQLIKVTQNESLVNKAASSRKANAARERFGSDRLNDEHSDEATYLRMAAVYESTATALQSLFAQHRRSLERSLNPMYKDWTDKQMDGVVENGEQEDRKSWDYQLKHLQGNLTPD